MTDIEFDMFVDSAVRELEQKQKSLMNAYKIGSGVYNEYALNQEDARLEFNNDGTVDLSFSIVMLGSWVSPNSWMWAWANNSLKDSLRKESSKLKELEEKTGMVIFGNEKVAADTQMANELVAMSVKHLGALGMYKVPLKNDSFLFVAIMKKA